MMASFPALVEPAALARHRAGDSGWVVLDASWHLPAAGRDARAEFESAHIPGARFFDLDATSDPASPLPHMLPSPEAFAAAVSALGVGPASRVAIYDTNRGAMAACRLWWMFRVFGHDAVAVLDGGLAAWIDAGLPVESGASASAPSGGFTARFRPRLVRSADAVAAGGETPIDARSAARFAGAAPEPRPGLAGGHIPGARNLPFDRLFDAESGRFLAPDDLRARFADAGIDLSAPLVASCGSGVTACVLVHALHQLGQGAVPVYDGSWAEWGAGGRPVETGPAGAGTA